MHNLLFCAHTLCMNYVTNTFLLVSSSVRSKQLLCFVHGQGQKREQKPITKKFVGFHNHCPQLAMLSGKEQGQGIQRFTVGRSLRQAASDISWDKMAEKAERDLEIRTRRRGRKGKAGTKTSNGVGDEGKEEREREEEKK